MTTNDDGMTTNDIQCDICGDDRFVLLVCADLGEGAFLKLLCDQCWHRAQYRASLIRRLAPAARIKRRVFDRIRASLG